MYGCECSWFKSVHEYLRNFFFLTFVYLLTKNYQYQGHSRPNQQMAVKSCLRKPFKLSPKLHLYEKLKNPKF